MEFEGHVYLLPLHSMSVGMTDMASPCRYPPGSGCRICMQMFSWFLLFIGVCSPHPSRGVWMEQWSHIPSASSFNVYVIDSWWVATWWRYCHHAHRLYTHHAATHQESTAESACSYFHGFHSLYGTMFEQHKKNSAQIYLTRCGWDHENPIHILYCKLSHKSALKVWQFHLSPT